MKRIIIFSHEYPPSLGGAGTIAETIYKYFSSAEGYDVSVITSNKTIQNEENHLYTSLLPPKFWPISYFIQYSKKLESADIIICNDPAAIYNAGKYFSHKLLLKTVCFIHGEEKYLNNSTFFTKIIDFKKYFLNAMYLSAEVVFVSDYIKQFYTDKHNVDLNKVKASIINPGVFSDDSKVIKNNYSEQNNFITVCRIHEKKGFKHMLKVFERLADIGLSFQWNVVGDGQFMDEFKALVNSSSIYKDINIIGAKNRSELPALYEANDFCILLSEFKESYGLSYLEAAHFGVKPIGYNRCGVIDVFKYVTNGLLLDDYMDVERNARKIYSFVNHFKISSASSLRTSLEFAQDIEKLISRLCKDTN